MSDPFQSENAEPGEKEIKKQLGQESISSIKNIAEAIIKKAPPRQSIGSSVLRMNEGKRYQALVDKGEVDWAQGFTAVAEFTIIDDIKSSPVLEEELRDNYPHLSNALGGNKKLYSIEIINNPNSPYLEGVLVMLFHNHPLNERKAPAITIGVSREGNIRIKGEDTRHSSSVKDVARHKLIIGDALKLVYDAIASGRVTTNLK